MTEMTAQDGDCRKRRAPPKEWGLLLPYPQFVTFVSVRRDEIPPRDLEEEDAS